MFFWESPEDVSQDLKKFCCHCSDGSCSSHHSTLAVCHLSPDFSLPSSYVLPDARDPPPCPPCDNAALQPSRSPCHTRLLRDHKVLRPTTLSKADLFELNTARVTEVRNKTETTSTAAFSPISFLSDDHSVLFIHQFSEICPIMPQSLNEHSLWLKH